MSGQRKDLSGLERKLLDQSQYDEKTRRTIRATSAADSVARAGGGECHGGRAGEGAWHLGCHCEAGSRVTGTSGEGQEDPRRGGSARTHAARGLLPAAVG